MSGSPQLCDSMTLAHLGVESQAPLRPLLLLVKPRANENKLSRSVWKGPVIFRKDLSLISSRKGRSPAGVGVVQLRLLPAPALRRKPGSVTSQPEKVHSWDTQLVRRGGLLVLCPTDVPVAPLGARTLRQFQDTVMDLVSGDSS